ncbi:MAG: NADH-quinone oxidoreductase subunit J [Anaerolineales bacterium]
MTPDLIVFFGLAAVAIASAVLMIASSNAIYSALYLVVNLTASAVFYLLLAAPFIALVQVTVYAGAIMVLFLFVIMLLGADRVELKPGLPMQAPIAVGLGFALIVILGYGLMSGVGTGAEGPILPVDFGGPRQVGEVLFQSYLLPFEVTSVLLLVAMVGAIVLTRDEPKAQP